MSDKNDVRSALKNEGARAMKEVSGHVDLDVQSQEWVAYAITQAAAAGVRIGVAHAGADVIENAHRLKTIEGLTAAQALEPFENWTVSFDSCEIPRPHDDDWPGHQ